MDWVAANRNDYAKRDRVMTRSAFRVPVVLELGVGGIRCRPPLGGASNGPAAALLAADGFVVSDGGLGFSTVRRGPTGADFGAANNATITVTQALAAVNSGSLGGVPFSVVDPKNQNPDVLVFQQINNAGGVDHPPPPPPPRNPKGPVRTGIGALEPTADIGKPPFVTDGARSWRPRSSTACPPLFWRARCGVSFGTPVTVDSGRRNRDSVGPTKFELHFSADATAALPLNHADLRVRDVIRIADGARSLVLGLEQLVAQSEAPLWSP
jgi:hypothetical protein